MITNLHDGRILIGEVEIMMVSEMPNREYIFSNTELNAHTLTS